jgi:hypothetical protein
MSISHKDPYNLSRFLIRYLSMHILYFDKSQFSFIIVSILSILERRKSHKKYFFVVYK